MQAYIDPRLENRDSILVSAAPENRVTNFDSLVGESTPETLLTVSYEKPIDQWISEYRAVSSALPETTVGIAVGETFRGAAAADSTSDGISPMRLGNGILIDAVSSAAELTGLGIKLNQYLQQYRGNSDASTVVCFDSVSALVENAGVERAFKFLHVFIGAAQNSNATVYAFLDRDEDPQSRSRILALFDAYADATESPNPAEWPVRTAY